MSTFLLGIVVLVILRTWPEKVFLPVPVADRAFAGSEVLSAGLLLGERIDELRSDRLGERRPPSGSTCLPCRPRCCLPCHDELTFLGGLVAACTCRDRACLAWRPRCCLRLARSACLLASLLLAPARPTAALSCVRSVAACACRDQPCLPSAACAVLRLCSRAGHHKVTAGYQRGSGGRSLSWRGTEGCLLLHKSCGKTPICFIHPISPRPTSSASSSAQAATVSPGSTPPSGVITPFGPPLIAYRCDDLRALTCGPLAPQEVSKGWGPASLAPCGSPSEPSAFGTSRSLHFDIHREGVEARHPLVHALLHFLGGTDEAHEVDRLGSGCACGRRGGTCRAS